jgi:hypothetical protein
MIAELDELLLLARDAQSLVLRPRERRKLMAELASTEGRLQRLRRQAVEAVLVDVLWQYLDCSRGTSAESATRRMLVEVMASSHVS